MSESNEERLSWCCIRTHCLQLHCSCFRGSYFCSDNCKCHGCRNSEHRRTYVEEHFELAQKKNPKAKAFKVPIVEEAAQTPAPVQEANQLFSQRSSGAVPGDGGLSHVKGCSCREIKCGNMSCECFKYMVGCTYKCKCEGCANSCGIKLSDFVSKTEIDDKKIIKLEQANTIGIKQEQTDTSNIKQEQTNTIVIRQEQTDTSVIKQEQTDTSGIKQEQTDTSVIKQEQTDTSGIKQEQTDTSGITSEVTNMEKRVRSEDDSCSYPSKSPRIWPSTKHDTSPS